MTIAHLDPATMQGHAAIFVKQAETDLQQWRDRPGMATPMHHLAVFHQHLADDDLQRATVALVHATHALEGVLIHDRTLVAQRAAMVRAHRSLVRAQAIYDYAR